MNVLLTLAVLLLLSYGDTKTANLELAFANLGRASDNLDLAPDNFRDNVSDVTMRYAINFIVDGDDLIGIPQIQIFSGRPIPDSLDLQRRGDEGNLEKRILIVEIVSQNGYDSLVNASFTITDILNELYSKNQKA